MALYDFDVTLSITHTKTIEADSLDDATVIVRRLAKEYGFVGSMVGEFITDYDAMDADHLTIGEPYQDDFTRFGEVTITPSDYLKED